MPVSYAGTVSEHTATRNAVGLFDVSHLGKALVRGPGAAEFVNSALTNDLRRIGPGKAQYTLCCTESGGVIDDLIAYYVSDDEIFLVPNAANTAAVVAALQSGRPHGLTITDEHRSYAVLAVQGPKSAEVRRRAGAADRHGLHGLCRRRLRRRRRCGCAAPATPANTATSCCRRGIGAGVVFDALVDAVGGCRRRAGRARRPRHAAHRDGLPAARPRTVAGDLAAAGALRLGDRLEARTRSGAATRCWPRRRPARSGCCAGCGRSAAACCGPT